MSTSCVFHLQVWPSTSADRGAITTALSRFLEVAGLSSELAVEVVELAGIVVVRATSSWAIAISGAGTWVPETEAQFDSAMRAIDPGCEISFGVRYPDDEQDLRDELNTTRAGEDASRRIEAFFSFSEGEVTTERSTTSVPVINAGFLVSRLFSVGDFFGVVDGAGTTLQAMLEKNGRVWIEVPAPQERGSYGKFVRREELAEMMRSLPEQITPLVTEGLQFTPF